MTNASLWGRQHHAAPTENVQDDAGCLCLPLLIPRLIHLAQRSGPT